MRDATATQEQLEIGRVETAFARLVDNRLALDRRELGDDLPARLTTNQDPTERTRIADSRADLPAAPLLVERQVRQVRTMAFAGMDDQQAQLSRGLQDAPDRVDDARGQRN